MVSGIERNQPLLDLVEYALQRSYSKPYDRGPYERHGD